MKKIFMILNFLLFILLVACSKKVELKLLSESHTISVSLKPTVSPTTSATPIIVVSEKFYSITKDEEDNYSLKLYDKDKKILYDSTWPKEPHIKLLGKNIIQVIISYGSSAYATFFYETNTGLISDIYDTPVFAENRKIIIIEKNKLIISDILDKKLFYKEIERNFSQTLPPSSAVFRAKFLNKNKLRITYFEGEDYKEKTEIIDLRK